MGDPRAARGGRGPARGGVGRVPVVVLGVTGCIGAYKACEVLRELQRREVDVHVVMTAAATRFVTPMTFEALSRHPVFHDQWALGASGDIRHISLADDADLLLVAPATANILGKLARGIADDALSTLYARDSRPGAGRPRHEREHVRAPRGAGEPRDSVARPRGGRRRARHAGTSPAAGSARAGSRRRPRSSTPRWRCSSAGASSRARRSWSPPARPWRTSTRCGSSRTARAGRWATASRRRRATAGRASCSSRGRPTSSRRPGSRRSRSARPRRCSARWRRRSDAPRW